MKSLSFIEVAGRWSASSPVEPAVVRSAVSRAYYGAFHAARELLVEKYGWYCKSSNEHQWVQRHFLNSSIHEMQFLGQMLLSLHNLRKRADYKLSDALIEQRELARTAAEHALEIHAQLAALTDAQIIAVREGMQRYRDSVGLT